MWQLSGLRRRRSGEMNARIRLVESRVFAAVPTGVHQARDFVSAALLRRGAPEAVVGDYRLMVSELASNAIQHGAGSELTVIVNDSDPPWWDVAVVCTAAATTQLPPPQEWRVADGQQGSGRGLGIVRKLADDVIVGVCGHLISIRCRIRKALA